MATDINKQNESASQSGTAPSSPVISSDSVNNSSKEAMSSGGVDVHEQQDGGARKGESNGHTGIAASDGLVKDTADSTSNLQEAEKPDSKLDGKPAGASEAAEPVSTTQDQLPVETTSTAQTPVADSTSIFHQTKLDHYDTPVKNDDSHKELKAETDPAAVSIQEGYVLVAHPDATVATPQASSGDNKESMPISEHAIEDAEGQEVEHYDPNTPPARIQAYARLEFPFFNFYIQKLSVTIGRRPPVSRSGSIPPAIPAMTDAVADHDKDQVALPHDSSTSLQNAGDAVLDGVKASGDLAGVQPSEEANVEPSVIKVKQEEEDKDGVPLLNQHSTSDGPVEPHVKMEDGGGTVQQKSDQWNAPIAPSHNVTSTMGTTSMTDSQVPVAAAAAPTPTGDAVADRTSVEPGPSLTAPPVASTSDLAGPTTAGQPSRTSKDGKAQVDVDLGPIKAVSRDHARLFFDNTINPRSGLTNSWSLEVRGRNGLVLDGKWRAKGEVSRLNNGSRIQIAERIFHFVLPNGVPYPTAPPSPVMDEYFEGHGHGYGYPPTPNGAKSPIIYGSDSDELRSDNDEFGYEYDDDDDDMDAEGPDGSPSHGNGRLLDEHGNPIRRKRGRPKKQYTVEQLAELELERQRRMDPSIPRRPRGRPPKSKKDDDPNDVSEYDIPATLPDIPIPPTPDIPVPQLPPVHSSTSTELPIQVFQPIMPVSERPPPPTLPLIDSDEPKLSKKQQAELKRAEKQRLKDEKTAQREKEKQEREAAKQAAKEAKAREVAEKKRKEDERKKAAAEEVKRIQEEKARNIEKEKAEKEKQKAAAAAALAEAKAKAQAEAKAKADADAQLKAEAAAKAKAANPTIAAPQAAQANAGAAHGGPPTIAGPSLPAGKQPSMVPMPGLQSKHSNTPPAPTHKQSALPVTASTPNSAAASRPPAPLAAVAAAPTPPPPAPSAAVVINPVHPSKKSAPSKSQTQQSGTPQPRHVPQQPAPRQSQPKAVQSPAPFVPTNQFQGRPDKPPYSYPALIAQAIYSTPNKQATLQHIHMWIPDKYPFFREQTNAQILAQAIKQNLAVNRAFVNIPLPTGVALWAIETEQAKFFDGNTFLPPPNAQQMPYYQAQQPQAQVPHQQQQQHQPSPIPIPMQGFPSQPQQPYQQHAHQMSPVPIQPYPPQYQHQQHHLHASSPAPLAASPTRYQNGSMASASPAPPPIPQQGAAGTNMPARGTPQPPSAPVPAPIPSTSSSSSSSSKIPILIARPPPTYVKPAPPVSAAATDPSSMVDNEGYPPLVIHDSKMHLSPTVFSSLTAQQLSNLQTIDTKQALNILQAFVVNYFKTELKKRKKAEKAAAKAGTATPMSASPSPAPAHGMKRPAPEDTGAFEAAKVQKVS